MSSFRLNESLYPPCTLVKTLFVFWIGLVGGYGTVEDTGMKGGEGPDELR
jgi:hypothetical protein